MKFGKLLSCSLMLVALFVFACGQNSSSERPLADSAADPSVAQAANPDSSSASEQPATRPTETAAQPQTQAQTQQARYRIPAFFENPDAAEPLAPILDPNTVPLHAAYAYRLAQQNPKLLTQIPCFCYCDRMGHKSLHDCFSSTHAEECDVCMNEAIEASQLAAKGLTPKDIRDAIIAKHHPRVDDTE